MGNGITMTSAKAEGSTIVMNISVPEGTDMELVEANMDKAATVAALKAADKDFVEGVAALGCSIKYVYSNGTDSAELLLTPEDLK